MSYFVEIRTTVRRAGKPRLIPLADVSNYRGFRSVFAYDTETSALITESGSMHGLRGIPVYADTLFMDFDSHDPAAFRTWLQNSRLYFVEYNSGNRSVHFHIPIEPIFGEWVPGALKAWTKKHAPTADTSFLHPAGQYRLAGTFHPKNPGSRKTQTAEGGSQLLVIQKPAARDYAASISIGSDSTREKFAAMLMAAKGEGHRRPWLWQAATVGAEAGLTPEEIFQGLTAWNAVMCHPPHDAMTITRQIESAFSRLAHK